MGKPAEKTHMRCVICGAEVWIEDGDYSCDCTAFPVQYLGSEDFPKNWVDEDYEVHKE